MDTQKVNKREPRRPNDQHTAELASRIEVGDTPGNVAEFGYAGSGSSRSAFPKARVMAPAECGTHALVAAEVGGWAVGD